MPDDDLLVRSQEAPQKAEPYANGPSVLSDCMAAARPRTQLGTLVWVDALKVDMATIHPAPPMTSDTYTAGR